MKAQRLRYGLTLIELLVVIAILGTLMGLLLAAVQQVRERANRAECANHLRQIALALHDYHDTHSSLPPGCSYRNGKDPCPHMSWCTRLLPFLEQEALWRETLQAFALESFFEVIPPHTGLGTVVPVFTCPSDSRTLTAADLGLFRVAFTAYLGVEGTDQGSKDGLLFLDSRGRWADVTDGTSNTLMVGERPPGCESVYRVVVRRVGAVQGRFGRDAPWGARTERPGARLPARPVCVQPRQRSEPVRHFPLLEPAPWRGTFPVRRRLGAFPQLLCRPSAAGPGDPRRG